jgi:serpin B
MPKFSIEQDLKLSDYLKGKGITDAFDINRADFSGITGSKSKKFAIGLVKQKSKIEIDEKGLEAASASAVVGYGLNPDDPQEIKETIIINRPFVYVLSDIESGLILFAGVFAGE